jgi:hypothetical protein
MKQFLLPLGLCLSLGAGALHAQERPKVNEGEVPRGEVVIRSDNGTTFQEFRNASGVYKVEVRPSKGRPYFLVDSDGNGSLDQIQWILYRW